MTRGSSSLASDWPAGRGSLNYPAVAALGELRDSSTQNVLYSQNDRRKLKNIKNNITTLGLP